MFPTHLQVLSGLSPHLLELVLGMYPVAMLNGVRKALAMGLRGKYVPTKTEQARRSSVASDTQPRTDLPLARHAATTGTNAALNYCVVILRLLDLPFTTHLVWSLFVHCMHSYIR